MFSDLLTEQKYMYPGICDLRLHAAYSIKITFYFDMSHVGHFPYISSIQWSLYFKTTHGTKQMWSYITGGLKIKVI